MRVFRGRGLLWGLLGCACASVLTVEAAQPNPNGTAYGRGVNAYFSGDLATAESSFAEAIGVDPQDPRPFYFRALCRLRAGRREEARDDFLVAATLEARARGSYPVGVSLERVQGRDRLVLEQFRWHARTAPAAVAGSQPSTTSERPNLAVFTDAGALRQAVSVPLDRLVEPVALSELREVSAAGVNSAPDPFADDPQTPADGKIRSGKLMGIVGRALLQSAPVPSLEGLRDQIPGLPQPANRDAATGADTDFEATVTDAPATDAPVTDDPAAADLFPDSATPATEPAVEATDEEPAAESVDEDPFG